MKTRRLNKASLVMLLIGCCVWLSCSTGVITGQSVKESRNATGFTSLSLAMSGTVYLTQGDRQSVEIEANKEALEYIETEVEGNTLVIRNRKGHWRNLGQVKIYVTMQEINRLDLSGSGSILGQNAIRSGALKINVSGSGDVKINALESPEISLTITGSGNINLAGKGDQTDLEATITGSGSFKADALAVARATISITGSGSARVNVLKELETHVTGSGNVLYKGNPIVNAHSTGSGRTSTM